MTAGPDVAISVIAPFAGRLMSEAAAGQRLMRGQQVLHLHQKGRPAASSDALIPRAGNRAGRGSYI
jgi:hypothetical protein